MTSGAIFSFLTYFCFINVQYEFYRTCMNVIIHPVKPVEPLHVTSIEAVINPTRYAAVSATIASWLLREGMERPIVDPSVYPKTKGLIIQAAAWEQVGINRQVVNCLQVPAAYAGPTQSFLAHLSFCELPELREVNVGPDVIYPGFQKPEVRLKLFWTEDCISTMEPSVVFLALVDDVNISFHGLLTKAALVSDRHYGLL